MSGKTLLSLLPQVRRMGAVARVAAWLAYALLAGLGAPVSGQPLLPSPDEPPPEQPSKPLIFRDAAGPPAPATSVEEAVARMRAEMREVAQRDLSAAVHQQRMQRLLDRYREEMRAWREQQGASGDVGLAVEQLERAFYEQALELAPDEATREEMRARSPRYQLLERRLPLLIAPEKYRGSIVVTDAVEPDELRVPWWKTTRFDSEALALEQVPESPQEELEPPEENLEADDTAKEEAEVAVLADESTTVQMHDDNTILRDIKNDEGNLVLIEGIRVWGGGAFQYDAVELEDIYATGGGSDSGTFTRRAEITVRSTLFDLGELKAQYDIDGDIWRDLYFRQVDDEKGYTLTLGNQTEPMSQENILGNKFIAPMEASAPSSAFATGKGMGILLNKWFERGQAPALFSIFDSEREAVTASIGIFGEDLENTNDTDWAVTGRTTAGRLRGGVGLHIGSSVTYRDGEFDRIAPRPELQGTDRILLASFDAERAAVVNLELMATRGSWHGSSEFYYADYRDGEVDATGYGGFVEVGYYLTGQSRAYRPRWGLWAPLKVGARNIFEVFGRISYTYGDSDIEPSNDLGVVTIGGSWYRHKIRVSANLLYSQTDRPVAGDDDGFGAGMRFQYLF